jgi:hypothetical protein
MFHPYISSATFVNKSIFISSSELHALCFVHSQALDASNRLVVPPYESNANDPNSQRSLNRLEHKTESKGYPLLRGWSKGIPRDTGTPRINTEMIAAVLWKLRFILRCQLFEVEDFSDRAALPKNLLL